MGASHIVNTHTIDTRVGGRSRYPGRVQRGPVVDVGGSIAEADRLRRSGALPQARQLLRHVVDLAQAASGADRVEVCTARRMLAEVMCELGERDGACEVLTENLAEAQAAFGPRHPASVRTLAVLAAVVHELGDFEAAERLYREVGDRIGDKGSRAGSLVRVRLALLQRDRGNIDAAREELAEAHQKHREAFGAEDPDTVQIAAQLAELHRDAGDSAAARRVLTVAYVAACAALGEDHEVTRNLESDLEKLEAPMPSAPVDLPEDSQSTRSIKRRHSKKGAPVVAAAEAAVPVVPAAPAPPSRGAFPAAPASPAAYPASPAAYPAAPASPAAYPAAPASPAAYPAAPASPAAYPAAPASPAPYPGGPAYPAAPASPAPFLAAPAGPAGLPSAPTSPAGHPAGHPAGAAGFLGTPTTPPAPFPPGHPLASPGRPAGATYTAASARSAAPVSPAPSAHTAQIPAQIPPQTRRRVVDHEAGLTGRRTPPAQTGYNEPRLAAAETVLTPAVIDPVTVPHGSARPRRSGAATVLIVLMVLIAIGGGVALAIIGAMLAMQS